MSVAEPTPSEIRLFLERRVLRGISKDHVLGNVTPNDETLASWLTLSDLLALETGEVSDALDRQPTGSQVNSLLRLRIAALQEVATFARCDVPPGIEEAAETEARLIEASNQDPSFFAARFMTEKPRLLKDRVDTVRRVLRQFPDLQVHQKGPYSQEWVQMVLRFDSEEPDFHVVFALEGPAYEMRRTVDRMEDSIARAADLSNQSHADSNRLGQNHQMHTEQLSPTALKIDLETAVAKTLSSFSATPIDPILIESVSKMTLPELRERLKELQRQSPAPTPLADRSQGDLSNSVLRAIEQAVSAREIRVRKWLKYLKQSRPTSEKQYLEAEARLTDGADQLLVDGWRLFRPPINRESERAEAARTLLTKHGDHPMCLETKDHPSFDALLHLGSRVADEATKVLASIESDRKALDLPQRHAVAQETL